MFVCLLSNLTLTHKSFKHKTNPVKTWHSTWEILSWSIYCLLKTHQKLSNWKGGCQEAILKEGDQKEKAEVQPSVKHSEASVVVGAFQPVMLKIVPHLMGIWTQKGAIRFWPTMQYNLESIWWATASFSAWQLSQTHCQQHTNHVFYGYMVKTVIFPPLCGCESLQPIDFPHSTC